MYRPPSVVQACTKNKASITKPAGHECLHLLFTPRFEKLTGPRSAVPFI